MCRIKSMVRKVYLKVDLGHILQLVTVVLFLLVQFSSVQSLSRVWLFVTPWIAACQASLSITTTWSSLKLKSIELVMPSSHLICCHPLLLLPSILPNIRVFPKSQLFTSGGQSIGVCFRLISFRMDCLDLLAVQGTLKSLLQHHSSKASSIMTARLYLYSL